MIKANRSTSLLLAVLVIIVIGAGVVTYNIRTASNEEQTDEARRVLLSPEASAQYTDVTGREVAIDEFEGDILLVYVWASWCPQCADDLVYLANLTQQYHDLGVSVLAMNRGEPRERAQRYLNSLGDASGLNLIIDVGDVFYSSIGGYAMPEVVIFNTGGEKVLHHQGILPREEVVAVLDSLVAEN